jgi:hypothetical protein
MIHSIGRYLLRVLIAFDVFVNVCLGGVPDSTISARVGYNAIRGKTWALVAEKVINTLFFFRPNHCRTAIKGDYLRAAQEQVSLRP